MDAGVREVTRDTYGSSLEMAASVLEALGETPAAAREAVRRFRQHDEATLAAQYQVKDDESKFLADRKSTRLNSSHSQISYAVFCLKKKNSFTRRTSCGTVSRARK